MVHWFDKSVRRNTLKKVSSVHKVQISTGILYKNLLPRLWATIIVMPWGNYHISLLASKQFSVIIFPHKSQTIVRSEMWKQKKIFCMVCERLAPPELNFFFRWLFWFVKFVHYYWHIWFDFGFGEFQKEKNLHTKLIFMEKTSAIYERRRLN